MINKPITEQMFKNAYKVTRSEKTPNGEYLKIRTYKWRNDKLYMKQFYTRLSDNEIILKTNWILREFTPTFKLSNIINWINDDVVKSKKTWKLYNKNS